MRVLLTAISSLVLALSATAQMNREPIQVVRGELIRSIASLKNLKQDPTLNPRVTRDLSGTLIKKSWKEPINDYGTKASGDPVVQKQFINPAQSEDPADELFTGTKVVKNLDGIGFTNVSPADPCLAQGPIHVIQMINGSQGAYLKIWDKYGTVVIPQTYMYQLIATPGYSGNGDPIAMYDPFADRYILSEFGTSEGVTSYINTLIFAVSITNDPTGGWRIYKFVDNSVFMDYPHYAVWPESIFGTTNDFNTAGNSYLGTSLMAFDKNKMYTGQSPVTMIRSMPGFLKSTVQPNSKPRTTAPVSISGNTPPAEPKSGLFLYYHDDNLTFPLNDVDSLGIISLTPDFENPANTLITSAGRMVVAPFKSNVCASRACIPSSSSNSYDAISDRFMHRVSYRNFGTHEALVANHTVDANYPATPAKAGIRWYELRRNSGSWNVVQQGTYSPDGDGRWMGSITINSSGQIALAFNSSGAGKFASIYFTGRNASDPAGIMTYDEGLIQQGTAFGTFNNRWGDYNDLTTDWENDSLFWFTAMYGSNNWKTKVASFKLEPLPLLDARLSTITNPQLNLAQCSPFINPVITLRNVGSSTLNTLNIYTQLNDNPASPAYTWNGSLAIGASVPVSLPAVAAIAGTNKLKIFVAAPNQGEDENKNNDTLTTQFTILTPKQSPLSESFEAPNFPDPEGWRVLNPDPGSLTWARNNSVGKSGAASGIMEFFNYPQNLQSDYLLSPVLEIGTADSLILSFDRAYKPYSSALAYADGLAVVVSTDCGGTFTEVWLKEGVELASVNSTTSSAYVPSPSDWVNTRIDLKPYINNAPQIIAGFKSINRFGNNLYLDNILLTAIRVPNRDAAVQTLSEPNNRICTRSFTPQVLLVNRGRDTLKTVTIFYQFGNGTTDSITWNGSLPLGNTASVNFSDYNKSITFSTAGKFPYKIYTRRPNGSPDENPENDAFENILTVFDPVPAPVKESFESPAFPPENWSANSNRTGQTWKRTSLAYSESTASAFIKNFRSSTTGKIDDLYGPRIQINNPDSVYLSFDVAHTTSVFPGSTELPMDTLQVLLTSDCGNTFTPIYKKWGQALVTTDINFPSEYPENDTIGFYPFSATQWRTERLDITSQLSPNSIAQVVFRNIGNNGNNTYLDNIRISTVTLPDRLKKDGYLIAPNPFENSFTVRHLQAPANLKGVQVINSMGQQVMLRTFKGNAPNNLLIDMSRLASGLYQVQLIYNNKVINTRMIKSK